jgi:hypothetical protein
MADRRWERRAAFVRPDLTSFYVSGPTPAARDLHVPSMVFDPVRYKRPPRATSRGGDRLG